jgi:gliding motility-associated-like protein
MISKSKNNMKQFVLLLLTFLTIEMTQAQDQFERLYRATGTSHNALDVKQTSDGGYLMLSLSQSSDFANVTKLDPKGNISWSKDYDFDEPLARSGDIELLEKDSFLFSVLELNTQLNNVVTKAAPNGEVVWSNAFGRPDFVASNLPVFREVELTANFDKGVSVFGQQGVLNNMGIYGARLDSLGNLLWAKNYFIDDNLPLSVLNGVQDAQMTQDSGFILCGGTSEFVSAADLMLTKLDSLGEVEWSNSYGDNLVFTAELGNAVVQTPDKGYIVAGFTVIFPLVPNLTENGLLMKTDSLGNVEWLQTINIDSSETVDGRFTDVAIDADGNILVSGYARSDVESYHLFMKFDLAGNILSNRKYNKNAGVNEKSSIVATQDDGAVLFQSARDDGATEPIPYLIKTNELGESSCSDTFIYELTTLDTLATNPINLLVESLDTVLLKEPLVMDYDSFSVPVLALNAPPAFCEGDPINVTFDATVDGAVSYAWSTGETTPMITVMEAGLFTVDVRIEEDVCFNLCDTVVIAVIGPPTVAIGQDLSGFCVNGVGVLEAQIQGAANQIEWSTGDNESFIFINQPGTYGVTVTNQCGSDEAQVVVTDFPEVLPSFVLEIDDSGLCAGENATVVADVFNATPNSVIWTATDGGMIVDGENAPILTAGTSGTYTITATNNCGTSTQETVLVAVPPTVNINVLLDELCMLDSAVISSTGTGFSTFEWSTGNATDNQITITEQGTYSITATTIACGTATAEITFDCEFPFDECVMIPNAFTPNNDSNNDGFSPVIPENCVEGITIRRLAVWSRWGKKVFDEASNNPIWDGNDGGEPAGADVYIYLVDAVNEDGEERIFKGDVTLIR